jgi:hypothetical protein
MNRLIDSIKWFGAATGALVPAWDFFKHDVPPLFPEIGLLMCAVSGAIAIVVSAYIPSRPKPIHGLQAIVWRGTILIVMSLGVLISYRILLESWTVLEPQSYQQRFQVGFGVVDWSLTNLGQEMKHAGNIRVADDLMLAGHAFRPGGPATIWKQSTIDSAGLILILLYVVGFVLWTTGFALLSKYRASVVAGNNTA